MSGLSEPSRYDKRYFYKKIPSSLTLRQDTENMHNTIKIDSEIFLRVTFVVLRLCFHITSKVLVVLRVKPLRPFHVVVSGPYHPCWMVIKMPHLHREPNVRIYGHLLAQFDQLDVYNLKVFTQKAIALLGCVCLSFHPVVWRSKIVKAGRLWSGASNRGYKANKNTDRLLALYGSWSHDFGGSLLQESWCLQLWWVK